MEKKPLNPVVTFGIYLYSLDIIRQLIAALSGLHDGISYF